MIDFTDPKFDPESCLNQFGEYQIRQKRNKNRFVCSNVAQWLSEDNSYGYIEVADASKLINLWVLLKMVKRFGFNYKVTNEWRK